MTDISLTPLDREPLFNNVQSYESMDLNALLEFVMSDIKNAFKYAEYVNLTDGTYSSAAERVAKYFITDIENKDINSEQDDNIIDTLNDSIGIKNEATNIIKDYIVYGNSFSYPYLPFTRKLYCHRCRKTYNIKVIDYKLDKQGIKGMCPVCRSVVPFKVIDVNNPDPGSIKVIRVNPKNMYQNYDPASGKSEYYMKLDDEYRRKIDNNDRHTINHMPWIFYQAHIEDRLIRFAPDQIFHMKVPQLAGIFQGWGLPSCISILDRLIRKHFYTKAELALLDDFITPKRVLYPTAGDTGDVLSNINTNKFVGKMQDMLKQYKKDKRSIMIAPSPIGYQSMGGEGKGLNLSGEEDFNTKQQLAASGFPSELYYMSASLQSLPTALRLMENIWSHIPVNLNNWLNWTVKKISTFLKVEKPDLRWKSIKVVDDLERRNLLFTLAGSQQVSLQTALETLGLDAKDELIKLVSQSTMQQEVLQDAAEDQKVKADVMGTGAPGGGGNNAMSGDPTGAATMAQADQIAQQWVTMDETNRHIQMAQLREQNQLLHAIAMSKYERIMAAERRQGGAQRVQELRQSGQGNYQQGM